ASSINPRRSSGVACRIESSCPCPTMTCISRPMPESESSSCTSSSRQPCPLIAYSEPPLRNMVREMVTSEYSIGSAPSELSMVSCTSARPSGGRPEVPAKMTSSILPPRSDLAPCSPITQARASTTLDLPDPFGPTMQVIPGSSWSVVEEANDLKPRSVRDLRYTVRTPHERRAGADGASCQRRPAGKQRPQRTTRGRRGPGTTPGGSDRCGRARRRPSPCSGSRCVRPRVRRRRRGARIEDRAGPDGRHQGPELQHLVGVEADAEHAQREAGPVPTGHGGGDPDLTAAREGRSAHGHP